MKNGIYPNIRFSDYLAWPEMSQSTLKHGRESMAHLRAAVAGEAAIVPTDDMILGSCLHTAFLEPEELANRVVKWTGGARRGKEWEAFKDDHAGQTILTENAWQAMEGMVASLRRHPFVREWQAKIEGVEVAAVGDVYGLKMKGRCDALTPDPMVDIKKVRSGDLRKFTYAIRDFGYDIQGAVYRHLFARERFVLVCVEDEPPYDVVPYELSPGWLRRGDEQALALIRNYLHCQTTGVWPGRSDSVITVEVPDWAESGSETEVMLEGQPVL